MNIKKYIKINSNLYFKQFDKYTKYHIAYFVIDCTINDIYIYMYINLTIIIYIF